MHAEDIRRVGFNCDINALLPAGSTLHTLGTPTTDNADLTLTALGIDPKIAKVQIEAAEDATAHAENASSWVRATIVNSNGGGPVAVYGEVIIQEEP
jgi:hypothetical protein